MNASQRLKALVLKTKAYVAEQTKRHPGAHVLTARPLERKPADLPLPVAFSYPPTLAEARPKEPWAQTLDEFRAQICGCLTCPLGATRKRFMFGSGNAKAKLVFMGLAPGAEEEAAGQLFSGEAGKLLGKMIAAMGLKRDEVYLMNALKCRLPHGREHADSKELEACRPYYEQQLRLIAPAVVCALGPEATQELLGPGTDFAQARGKFFDVKGWLVMPTFHPAELLRHEGLKRQAWEDLKALLKKIP
jgi:DNA polymerase